MKKLKFLLFTVILTLFWTINLPHVHAETDRLINGDVVNVPYYYTHHQGSSYYWDSFRYITRISDGSYVYCIEPLVHIDKDEDYNVLTDDLPKYAGIEEHTWKRIESVAYYGYGYKKGEIDHTDARWYAATQMMIWQLANPKVEAYFTHTIRGERDDNILRTEVNEINALVDDYTKPALDIPDKMFLGTKKSILNKDGDLASYQILNASGGKVTKARNYLVLNPTALGELTFTLSKKRNIYNESPKLYYSAHSQKALARGDIDPLEFNYRVKVDGMKVTLQKRDYDTGLSDGQGDATLEGAVYGIFKSDGTKIKEVITDKFGNAESDYLETDTEYYFQELIPSKGYNIDPEKHYFTLGSSTTLQKDTASTIVTVKERVKKRNLTLFKVYGGSETGSLMPEVGIKFNIYLKSSNELVTTITTNSSGLASTTLPYGVYTIKQVNAPPNYELLKDFEITIDEDSDEPLYMTLANNPIKAKVKVIKKDRETHEIIKKSHIKFKIKNLDTGSYVCQSITYPSTSTVCEFETTELGEFYTPFALASGHYQIEEMDEPLYGYVWNKEPLQFEIGENSNILNDPQIGSYIELSFYNDPVKASLSINKKGEELNIINSKFEYSEIPLEDVVFYLRAKEDIVINDKLLFKKGELVEVLKTDRFGYAKTSLLPLGKYTLQEISSNKNHIVDPNIYDIEFTYDKEHKVITKTIELKNYLPKGTLEFTKQDLATSEALPNTLIKIFTTKDELIFEGRTNSSGQIIIDHLPVGKYYIKESEAPLGYKISEEKMYFEIKENGEVVKSTMKDERIEEERIILEVPNTYKFDYKIPLIAGFVILTLGILICIYGKRKK